MLVVHPRARATRRLVHQLHLLPEDPLWLPAPTTPIASRAAQLIIDDPTMTLPDIARAVATSRRTLERSFVAATGLTAGAWRRRSRILGSLEYLAAGMPVSHTAVAVGYTTPSAFVTAFKNDWAGRPASSSDADLHLTTNTKRRGRG